MLENSENCDEIKGKSLPEFGSELYMFKLNSVQEELLSKLGAEQNQFIFIFRINNVVAKVVVAGNKELTLAEASVFGQKAAELIEINNPVNK